MPAPIPGATKADEKEIDRLMVSPHGLEIRIRLLDLEHRPMADYSDLLADGTVTVDATADITRALDLKLADPLNTVGLTPSVFTNDAIYMSRMIDILYTVIDPENGKRYPIPIFCGPIDAVSRNGVYVDIKAVGKEIITMPALWRAKNYKKNTKKYDIAIKVLVGMYGESPQYINLPRNDAKISSKMKLNDEDIGWLVVRRLFGSRVFYDGSGVCRRKSDGTNSRLFFSEAWLNGPPQIQYDMKNMSNAVWMEGGKPNKKAKKNIKFRITLKGKNPLSPKKLGRRGKGRFLWTKISDGSIRKKSALRKAAVRKLKQLARANTTVSWSGIPNPRAEEWDIARMKAAGNDVTFQLTKFTIPLIAGKDASYGYLKKNVSGSKSKKKTGKGNGNGSKGKGNRARDGVL